MHMNTHHVQYIQIHTNTDISCNTYQNRLIYVIHFNTHIIVCKFQYTQIPINIYNTYYMYSTYANTKYIPILIITNNTYQTIPTYVIHANTHKYV